MKFMSVLVINWDKTNKFLSVLYTDPKVQT